MCAWMSEHARVLESFLMDSIQKAEQRGLPVSLQVAQMEMTRAALEIEALQDQAFNLLKVREEVNEIRVSVDCLTSLVQSVGGTLVALLGNLVGTSAVPVNTTSSARSGGLEPTAGQSKLPQTP